MKMIAGYLENAIKILLPAEESDQKLKAHFDRQALAYRRLATERANKLGLAPPSKPNVH
jgi:hypothetical protein